MSDWPVLPLEPLVRLRVEGGLPALDDATEAVVARLWAAASAERRLFNGRVFSADRVGAGEIVGHWTEYRRVVAQMAEPGLVSVLGVRSLAVCGVLVGPDGVVVGRREANSAYQAGMWQLPPAGSVDESAATADGADWRRAILAELREELGIEAGEVTALRPLCLVQHPSGVLDMGVRIDTGLDAAGLLRRHRELGNAEYDRLLVGPAVEVMGRVAALGGVPVPSAWPLLIAAGLVDREVRGAMSREA